MMSPTLKQMRYFEALARHGHFGRAAEVSNISQPALSMQIREMEAHLGIALFERGPKAVRLTAFGETVRERVREILRATDDIADLARLARGGLTGRLRLGVIPTIAPYLLPRIVSAIDPEGSGLELDIRETTTSHLLRELSEGRLDTAIVALPISEPGIEEAALFAEPFVLVRPEVEGGDRMPAREELREMRLLLLEEGHCFRDQALSFCDMGPRTYGLDATSLGTLVQMVGAGMGVTLVPQMAVAVETRAAPVAIGRFDPPEPERTIGLIWRRSTPLSDELRALALRLRDVIADDGPSPRENGLVREGETLSDRKPRAI
ncbi:hydrogen peroxide-inducible genes activator [Palleronia sp. LCG004]|uniref:hydrogen peroxide-inducible genes activator n=1 Tax=Palleronia sp. LCG004 TaxID=3079304 RepID=UPI002942F28E|nr:hydrogen peroxide-inducible genes activator [Palleronia sp. LCG004]WOI56342.1 hydrogen peroxide-inducible genes activator [Palleronia sp. LCG004]